MDLKKTICPAFVSGWAFVLFLIGSIFLAGCIEDIVTTAVPTRVRPSITPQHTPIRTLPPTWTPTSTWTPRPPTLTRTPTQTPTITPSPDPALVCETFDLIAAPDNGIQVAYAGRIAFSWQNAPPNTEIHITILHRETDEGILVRWPAQQSLNMPVEMSYLPAPGRYDWRLVIYDELLGELCPVEGWFERNPPDENSPTPTSEAALVTPTPASS
jgi:hypothetical protein